ncbi:MAG: hypothetical protein HDS66_05825 [Bacteroidales bacterium]|nr:hypothetical protein [Bacteroidales bacterium]
MSYDRLARGFDMLGPVKMWRENGLTKPVTVNDKIDARAMDEFFGRLDERFEDVKTIRHNNKKYIDTVAAFDIESSNLNNVLNLEPMAKIFNGIKTDAFGVKVKEYVDLKDKIIPKCANMVVWMICIAGVRLFGRDWDQFKKFEEQFHARYSHLGRLKVGVHNFGFEFTFMHNILNMDEVFSLKSQRPVRAFDGVFEYYDTLCLSGCSLEMMDLTKHKVEKMVGDWNYDKVRHNRTPLTKRELGYCDGDVMKPTAWVAEKLENTGFNICTMPMTSTGFVRADLLNRVRESKKDFKFIKTKLTLSASDYKILRKCFRGGDTEAGPLHANVKVVGVCAYDIGSAHPFQIISKKFPMGKFKKMEIEPGDTKTLIRMLKRYACVFTLDMNDFEQIVDFSNWCNKSKCEELEGAEIINGRVIAAKHIKLTVNEIYFGILLKNYNVAELFEKGKAVIVPHTFRYCRKDYLPKPLIEACLDYFEKKTTLKDIPEDIAKKKYGWDEPTAKFFYALYKSWLNGQFGDYAMDPLRGEWCVDDENEFYELWGQREESVKRDRRIDREKFDLWRVSMKKWPYGEVEGTEDEYRQFRNWYKETRDTVARVKGFKPMRNWNVFDADGNPVKEHGRNSWQDVAGYNKGRKRYKFYPWGVWIVAYSTQQLLTPVFGLPREELLAAGMPDWMGRELDGYGPKHEPIWGDPIPVIGLEDDFVYCDTDCDKYLIKPEYYYLFEAMNARMTKDLEIALISSKIDPDRARPAGPTGDKYQMGLYEFDGIYAEFKTLGSKRYAGLKAVPLPNNGTDEDKAAKKAAYENDCHICQLGMLGPYRFTYELETTVAGCGKFNKKNLDFDLSHYSDSELDWDGVDFENPDDPMPKKPKPKKRLPQLLKEIQQKEGLLSPIDAFRFNLNIPAEYTGKLTHTEFTVAKASKPIRVKVTDYLGFSNEVEIYSGTHLGPQEYLMSDKTRYEEQLIKVQKLSMRL